VLPKKAGSALKTLTVIVLPLPETHAAPLVFRMTVEAVFVQPDHAVHLFLAGTVKMGATKVVPPFPKPPAVAMQKLVEAKKTASSSWAKVSEVSGRTSSENAATMRAMWIFIKFLLGAALERTDCALSIEKVGRFRKPVQERRETFDRRILLLRPSRWNPEPFRRRHVDSQD
jgi:hypothetical protein